MSEDNKWKEGSLDGQNEKLFLLAMKMNEMTKLAIQDKLSRLKEHVNATAKQHDHPLMREFAQYVNNIKVE